jgi:Xaa-Pro aminopeptidase
MQCSGRWQSVGDMEPPALFGANHLSARPVGFDPTTVLAAVAMTTSNIGLVATAVVAENMVFGVEAILARDGVGAAFFEDIIIIGRDGNELITNTPLYW